VCLTSPKSVRTLVIALEEATLLSSLRARRSNVAVALVVGSAFLDPAATGEIFKCVAKDQRPLYQNFPCEFDSLGTWPNMSTAKAASNSNPNAARANVASAAKPTKGELRVGMTTDEVKAVLGEPEEMVDDEPAEGSRVSRWRYADGRSVLFDHKHRVLELQR